MAKHIDTENKVCQCPDCGEEFDYNLDEHICKNCHYLLKDDSKLRIHLREEFVDTGFIQVFQWRNFTDYFELELNKARHDEREKIIQDIEKMIISETTNTIVIKKSDWKRFKELSKGENDVKD
jgi:hypothetical protein